MPEDIIGICSWTLGIPELDALMAKIADLGLNGVQYCESMDAHTAGDVLAAAGRYGLEIIIFDPFDCRPGSLNGEATRENAVRFYQRAIDFAAQLGCGQTLQGLSTWTENCRSSQDAWQFMVESLRDIQAYAAKKHVPLAYEPCNLYEVPYIHTASEFQQLRKDSGCRDIAVLLDSFHMNIGEKDPLAILEDCANDNAVFHISGNNREGINQGHIDFAACHQALRSGGFNGPCAVEFVLRGNPVNTPPRNPQEMAELSRQIRESVAIWRSYGSLNNNSRIA